jgi:DNA-binding FrmR family transcriptional regulator
MMDAETKKNVEARLRRAEGQIGGLRRMIGEDEYCVDLLLQISAAQGALGRIGQIVLASHIETCVSDAFERGTPSDRSKKIDELMDVFSRYSRIGAR